MKQIKLAVIALFTFATLGTANAQDSDNPWVVGFGVNAVDIRGSRKFENLVKDGLGTNDWNILPSISRLSAEKYLSDGFTVQVAGSLNKIETFLKKNDSDFLYYAIDANVKYDLDPLVNLIFKNTTPYFNPYIYLGGGYTSIDSSGEGMLNAGAGFNTWFNDNLGLNFQTGAKHGFGENVRGHYQHSIGLVFKFGGTDTDGDGIFDKNDACPEIAGLKEFNGCPDTDGDGIKDADDACPEVAGLAALNGCPDTDGDGIADKDDACPTVKGTKANNGCPDTDGDGVVDGKDKCPAVAGPSENAGCPWPDTDGDSVLDKDDKCPKVVGVASNNGCPEVLITKAAEKKLNEFARAIYFNSGRTTFKAGVIANLDRIASIMTEYPKANFSVQGHTDSQGRAANNKRLSEKRAKAVLSYLADKAGIATSRLTSAGFGEEYPIADNKTRAGRSQNRRVEIKLVK